MRVRPVVAWYDLWAGVFVDLQKRRVYVLPVPCLGIVISWGKDTQPLTPRWPGAAGSHHLPPPPPTISDNPKPSRYLGDPGQHQRQQ